MLRETTLSSANPGPSQFRSFNSRALRACRRFSIFGGLVVTLAGCADRLLLYPTTDAIDAGTAVRRTICVAGANLEIWTARSSAANDPAAYVLDFTGNATRAEWIAGDLADLWSGASAEVWVVNYPGYGQSTGPATLK